MITVVIADPKYATSTLHCCTYNWCEAKWINTGTVYVVVANQWRRGLYPWYGKCRTIPNSGTATMAWTFAVILLVVHLDRASMLGIVSLCLYKKCKCCSLQLLVSFTAWGNHKPVADSRRPTLFVSSVYCGLNVFSLTVFFGDYRQQLILTSVMSNSHLLICC